MVLTQHEIYQSNTARNSRFPYHYGSYATAGLRKKELRKSLCFHTTMVLTQPATAFKMLRLFISFHTTMVLTQLGKKKNCVRCRPASFHTTMVLTQLGMVLRRWRPSRKFPYHYGSYATKNVFIWWSVGFCFHTTMVLTQPKNQVAATSPVYVFPYHYGSYATSGWKRCGEKLWSFPYHYGSYATGVSADYVITFITCFHTTMVLTQLGYRLYKVIVKHPVSIPLWFLRNSCSMGYRFRRCKSFHTTMVLTQQNAQMCL